MRRLYELGLTSSKAGNISCRTDEGFCISASGVDKATLQADGVLALDTRWRAAGRPPPGRPASGEPTSEQRPPRQSASGARERLKPSSEYLFHKAFYEAAPHIACVVHAHPPFATAYASSATVPNTRILPSIRRSLGEVALVPYRRPGTEHLGDAVGDAVRSGAHGLVLAHHGVVVGGGSLGEAFERLVALELCAQIESGAARLGRPISLSDAQLQLAAEHAHGRGTDSGGTDSGGDRPGYGSDVSAVAEVLVGLVHRAGNRRLFTTAHGAFSVRTGDGFLITPRHADRSRLQPAQFVEVRGNSYRNHAYCGPPAAGRSAPLHAAIYDAHPGVRSIAIVQSPAVMAFAVTGRPLVTNTLAESYVLLQEIPLLGFGPQYTDPSEVARRIDERHPAVLIANECLVVTGESPEATFGRMEVAEFTARSALAAGTIAANRPMDDSVIDELRRVYLR